MSTLRTKNQPVKTLNPEKVDISIDRSPGKRDLSPENGNCQLSTKEKAGEEAKKTRRTFLENIDAIACGVEAWFEENTGHSRRVNETTVDIARALGIPEVEIKRWASSRLSRDTEKFNGVKSLLEKLQGSLLDQDDNKRCPHRTIRSDPK